MPDDKLNKLIPALMKSSNQHTNQAEIYQGVFEVLNAILEQIRNTLSPEQIKIDVKEAEKLFRLHRALQDYSSSGCREHVIHSFRVFLLGLLFLSGSDDLKNFWEERIKSRIRQMAEYQMRNKGFVDEILRDYFDRNTDFICKICVFWVIVSLFHDLGYILLLLKEILPLDVNVQPNYKQLLQGLTQFYSGFFSEIFGSSVDLNKCGSVDDHGYLSSVLLGSKILTIDFAHDLDRFLCYEAMFAVGFHDKPYLSPLSPFLQLLVFADMVDEQARNIEEGMQANNLKEESVVFAGTSIKVLMNFDTAQNSENYFEKAKAQFKMPPDVESFFQSQGFRSKYKHMNVGGIELTIMCTPPEVGRLTLFFHRECGRLSPLDQRSASSIREPYCIHCNSSP
jgi:hypothetical protein